MNLYGYAYKERYFIADFDDKYLNAKCKVIECIKALNQLTPEQNQQLARECFASMGMAMSLEQFIHHMENGGQG